MKKGLVFAICAGAVILLSMSVSLFAQESDANPGNKRQDITTVSGVTYERCKITRVEPDGISVFHSKGIAKIPFSELPEDMQKQFNWNPEKAAAYAEDRAQRRREFAERQKVAAQDELGKKRLRENEADAEAEMRKLASETAKQKQGLRIKAAQVLEEGLLAFASEPFTHTIKGGTGSHNKRVKRYREFNVSSSDESSGGGSKVPVYGIDPVLIVGLPGNMVDGAEWEGDLYPAGNYRYTDVSGAERTVRRYASSLAVAVKLQSEP